MKTGFRLYLFGSLCVAWAVCRPVPVAAQTVNAWTITGSGLWHVAANWSVGQPPYETNGIVAISNFNSKVVTADATTPPTNLFLRNLFIRAFQNRTNTLVLTNLAARLEIYRGLTLDSGALLLAYNSQVLVDGALGGELTLTAANAALVNSSLLLTNGSLLKVGNLTGTAGVSLTNSTLRVADGDLRIGAIDHANGRLTLNGGLIEVGNELTVGDVNSSTGLVTVVNGTFSAVNTNFNARLGERGRATFILSNGVVNFDDVSVGRQATGVGLLIQAGGTMNIGTLSIGRFPSAVGTVFLGGGLLNVTNGSVYVGREGSGTLTNAGGTIIASRLIVAGDTNTAQGTARFIGGESRFSSGLHLGSDVSTGQVFVAGGTLLFTNASSAVTSAVVNGTFTMTGGRVEFDLLQLTNSTGTAQLNGGTLVARGLTVSNGAPFVVGDGTNPAVLDLQGGDFSFADGLIVSSKATLTGCGNLTGALTLLAGGTNRFQSLCPGMIAITNMARVPRGVRFSFNSGAGTNYTVEFKTNFNQANWQFLRTVTGHGALENVTNAPAPFGPRFYRVRTP
ncbi:MAG TPA: hypothetical protein VGK40_12245 [Verrucomicrobiae bacterium]|jgi:hypothetical protein